MIIGRAKRNANDGSAQLRIFFASLRLCAKTCVRDFERQFSRGDRTTGRGDYDGDYVSELAVYRPSNKSWWMANMPVWGLFVYGDTGVIPTASLVKTDW